MNGLKKLIRRLFTIKNIKWTGERIPDNELYRKALSIAIPATVEGALLSIISSIDTMMVGTISPAAITAVGLTSQPRMILLIIAQALCVGTTALVARRKGANDQRGANSVLAQSMLLITIVGIIISLVGHFFAEQIMWIAGAKEETIGMATEYFQIIASCLIFNCWSLCLCAAMRAIGQTKITMVTNIAANLVNVFLNYCLIGGKLGFPQLGVKGAAIATAAGTVVSCIIAFAFALRKDGYIRYQPRLAKFDKQTMHGLMRVGSSSMAESAFLRLGFFINARLIADIGVNQFAAYQIVQQVTMLSFTLGDGVSTAGATLVGQSLGAKRKDGAMAYVRTCRKISLVASILLMIGIFFARRNLAALFTNDKAIITGASVAFIVVIFGIISQNGRVVFSGCLRGAGDVKYVAVCALLSVTVIRPILTYIFCYPANRLFPNAFFDVTGPWIAFVLDAWIREALLKKRVNSGKFLDIRL
ncbi:MAG: MATE family efflux transporter [Clostridia bacterium]|nr:MATE family efflux transporter [Clostridia bacterium]